MRSVNSNMSNKTAPSGVGNRPAAKVSAAQGVKSVRFGSQLLAIEQRMLFDGALAVSVDASRTAADAPDKNTIVDKSIDRLALLGGAAAKAAPSLAARDLVVIDTSIDDWQTVAGAVSPNSQLLLLNPEQDGLSQIANAMVGGNYKSVHIVSHGDDGKLKLGTRSVTAANIGQYSADLERIGQNLTESGDIVLYGCEIGKGAAGASFLQALARATNADVAASTNNTGGSAQGGDWVLEAQTGSIESAAALNTAALSTYAGLLPAYNVALTIVETSDVNTDPASNALINDANPEIARTVSVAPGEIVRYRMVVELPEGNTNAASLNVTLPTGLKFLNDNSAAVGFVSNSTISSSVISGGNIAGGGTSLGGIASLRPTQVIGAAQISGGATTGAGVSFDLGNLVNADSDANAEYVVIEFNAMVDNASPAIVRGAQQAASFNFVAAVASGISIPSDVDRLSIIEPRIVDVNKQFVSISGNVATFEVTFSNSGNANADSVRVVDTFAAYPNISFGSLGAVTVNGTPITVTNTSAGVDFVIGTLNPNDVVNITYTGVVGSLSQAVPAQDVKVTYTSLSQYGKVLDTGLGGPAISFTDGERVGDTTAYGSTLNTYSATASAGIGLGTGTISGRLWDDTPAYGAGAPSETYTAGERTLGGVAVDLYDDNISTTNPIASTVTKADGTYSFNTLMASNYRVAVVTPTFNDSGVGGSGLVKIHYDAAGGTPIQKSDGVIPVTLTAGANVINRDFGFIQVNEAPIVFKPGDKTIAASTSTTPTVLSFDNGTGANSAGFISVTDEIQNIATANVATLSVAHGTLNIAAGSNAGFTITGLGTGTVTITGAINSLTAGAPTINTILQRLQYTPTTNYVGTDQLTIKIEDKGAFGDAPNGDCIPNDPNLDNLSDTKIVNITMVLANNPPVAVDDVRSVQANQTITNGQAINGNGLGDAKDTDPDAADAGLLTICGVVAGNTTTVGNTGIATSIAGTWGNLVLQSNGSYTYTPNAAAMALPSGATRVDQFSYCLQDPAGSKDVGLITINLTGTNVVPANNPPVAVDDVRTIQGNQTITNGQAINGNGLGDVKDTDPDAADAGLLTICGVEAGNKTTVGTTGVGSAIVGTYGTLVLQANGSYTYTPNALGQALPVGTTRVDQFSYCLQDPAGAKDVGVITINLTGVKNPPAGADKFIPLTEDVPYRINPSDFGFTDVDGDTFKAVRITELPNPAGGKLFFDGQEVVFTAANPFLTVPIADIGKLEFRPAPNVNTANLSAPPSISFQVCDSDGVLDPTPNKLTFSIAPANDPPKASQSVYDMDSGSPSCALDGLVLAAGTKPGVSDPDIPVDTLTVAITTVPPATEGQYFIGSSTAPLKAGDTLTPAQLQQLCFKPNSAISGTPNATGRIPTTPLTFTVSDGKGGQDTSGSIQVNLRPQPVISVPPIQPPTTSVPPIVVPPVVPPLVSPPVSRTVSTASALRTFDDIRLSPIEDAKDLDAGGFFDAGTIKAVWNRERVAGVQVVAEEKQSVPAKQEVDCVPTPKEKPKLKAVKRSVFAETLKDNTNKNFSEQLKTAQKRFKPPARLVPKPSVVKEC